MVLSVLMILTMFAGCGSKNTEGEKTDAGNAEQVETTAPGSAEDSEGGKTDTGYDEFPAGLTAEKIGSIEAVDSIDPKANGLIYTDKNGKYGIMSLDGKTDTGAKYTACKTIDEYFEVTTVDPATVNNVAALNCCGVVDATGKEIIPMNYAAFKKLSDRYFQVCEATGQTTDEDEALIYMTDKMFSITASEGDALFTGKWYIYDIVAGKVLDGATGTQKYINTAKGNLVRYITDNKEQIVINEKGEKIPENASLLGNGYYTLITDGAGAVYNSDQTKVFDYDPNGFVPCDGNSDYILASKYEENGSKYVLMDTTGKVVSAEFTGRPEFYGDLVLVGEKVYDFEGKNVIDGTFKSVYYDEFIENVWILKNDKDFTVITKDGTVLYQGTEDDTTHIDVYNFLISKKVDGKNMYYSFADKDFTLKGSSVDNWLVKVLNSDGNYDVVDTISGKTVISDCSVSSSVTVPGSAIYVYTKNADGGYDIYAVK